MAFKNTVLIIGVVATMASTCAHAQIGGKDLKGLKNSIEQVQRQGQPPQAAPQQAAQPDNKKAGKAEADDNDRKKQSEKLIADGYRAMLKQMGATTVSACEKYMLKEIINAEQATRSNAENAATKKEQKEMLERADIIKGMAPVTARAGCLLRYYVAVEYFVFSTSMVENEDKVMIAMTEDNLTEKSLKSARETMTVSGAKFFETYIYSEKDAAEIEKKLGAKKGTYAAAAQLKAKRLENLLGIFASHPQPLGCSEVTPAPLVMDCK
jgi:hypothetical protein